MSDIKFSYRNYFKPTPENLQYISMSIRSVIGAVAGTTLVMEANKWVTGSILVSGFVLDELIKFFGHVSEESKRVISVEVDPKTEVKVKDEIKDTEK